MNMSTPRFIVLLSGLALLTVGLLALRFPVFLSDYNQWGFRINCGSGFQSTLTQAGLADPAGSHFIDQCHTAIATRRAWAIPLALSGVLLLSALLVRPRRRRLAITASIRPVATFARCPQLLLSQPGLELPSTPGPPEHAGRRPTGSSHPSQCTKKLVMRRFWNALSPAVSQSARRGHLLAGTRVTDVTDAAMASATQAKHAAWCKAAVRTDSSQVGSRKPFRRNKSHTSTIRAPRTYSMRVWPYDATGCFG